MSFNYSHLQVIKRDNEIKGTVSCKIALYRIFLQCGVRTWGQVIRALEKSGQGGIIEQLQLQLLESYGKVRMHFEDNTAR